MDKLLQELQERMDRVEQKMRSSMLEIERRLESASDEGKIKELEDALLALQVDVTKLKERSYALNPKRAELEERVRKLEHTDPQDRGEYPRTMLADVKRILGTVNEK